MSMRKQIEALQKKRNALLDSVTTLSNLAADEERLFTEAKEVGWSTIVLSARIQRQEG
jgi:hypothetical protein